MIKLINKLPENVIGLEATGKINDSDYQNIVIPTIERALKTNEKVSVLFHAGDNFKGYTLKAMYDDTKLGLDHFGQWDKCAFVTDKTWLRLAVNTADLLWPYHIKLFHNSEMKKAQSWVIEKRKF